MKEFKTSVVCRGCRKNFQIEFQAPLRFTYKTLSVQCPKCDSELEAQVRQVSPFRCETRSKMIKHTQKLLKMLKINEKTLQ